MILESRIDRIEHERAFASLKSRRSITLLLYVLCNFAKFGSKIVLLFVLRNFAKFGSKTVDSRDACTNDFYALAIDQAIIVAIIELESYYPD